MKIGIIGAMIEEVALLKEDIQNTIAKTLGNNEYFSGDLYGLETVLVFSRWGKVASTSAVTTLINYFNIDLVIFTGVAGAIAQHLNIGDIVISDKLYQHDMDARPHFKKHEIPLTGKIFFNSNEKLINSAKDACDKFASEDIHAAIPAKIIDKFHIKKPKVSIGIIASGDCFVADPKKIKEIALDNPNTLAVEMEGAAVAQVCEAYNIPFVSIRIISDKADHSAAIDNVAFFTDAASFYSRGIIKNLFKIPPG